MAGDEWEQARAYVRMLRENGHTDEDIRQMALERGWTQEQVEQLLPGRALRDPPRPPSPSPHAGSGREHGGSDEGGRRSVPKRGRVSSLLPLLVSVFVALAVGWFQARSFEGIPVWHSVDTTLPWWSWPAIPALALAVLCMFRPERRRQVWALVWGLAAGLLVGRLVLPGGFGFRIGALLWSATDIATRIHLGHAWPVTAALMALVTVLAADSFAQLAAFCPISPRAWSPHTQIRPHGGTASHAAVSAFAPSGRRGSRGAAST